MNEFEIEDKEVLPPSELETEDTPPPSEEMAADADLRGEEAVVDEASLVDAEEEPSPSGEQPHTQEDEPVEETRVADELIAASEADEPKGSELLAENEFIETPEDIGEPLLDAVEENEEEITTEAEEVEATEEPLVEPAVASPVEVPDDDRMWYVVHCYSGYENKVRHNLEQRIETMGMKDKIFDVVVPTEEEIEIKDGKRRTVERRVFPGYILVQMIMNEDSWYVVRNTPGVTGFVGMGNEPTPLRPEEVSQIVKRMEADAPRIKVTFKTGQKVRIIDGPFNDFIGTVSEIDMERTKVRVMVSFFGRETPVELDFLQVEKA